tara:strand:- start:7067 stop:7363 length:297 start_codon:yes stop_codon:yes gene_type:complete
MKKCYICLDYKNQFKLLDCKHELCQQCYFKILLTCPFCRLPFIRVENNKKIKKKKPPYITVENIKTKIRNRRKNISYFDFLEIKRKRKIKTESGYEKY